MEGNRERERGVVLAETFTLSASSRSISFSPLRALACLRVPSRERLARSGGKDDPTRQLPEWGVDFSFGRVSCLP